MKELCEAFAYFSKQSHLQCCLRGSILGLLPFFAKEEWLAILRSNIKAFLKSSMQLPSINWWATLAVWLDFPYMHYTIYMLSQSSWIWMTHDKSFHLLPTSSFPSFLLTKLEHAFHTQVLNKTQPEALPKIAMENVLLKASAVSFETLFIVASHPSRGPSSGMASTSPALETYIEELLPVLFTLFHS